MADYSWPSVLGLYAAMTLLVVGTGWALYRAVSSGAVSMDEGPKYRMLVDDALPTGAGAATSSARGEDDERNG